MQTGSSQIARVDLEFIMWLRWPELSVLPLPSSYMLGLLVSATILKLEITVFKGLNILRRSRQDDCEFKVSLD